jgi:hypothetical protein
MIILMQYIRCDFIDLLHKLDYFAKFWFFHAGFESSGSIRENIIETINLFRLRQLENVSKPSVAK